MREAKYRGGIVLVLAWVTFSTCEYFKGNPRRHARSLGVGEKLEISPFGGPFGRGTISPVRGDTELAKGRVVSEREHQFRGAFQSRAGRWASWHPSSSLRALVTK